MDLFSSQGLLCQLGMVRRRQFEGLPTGCRLLSKDPKIAVLNLSGPDDGFSTGLRRIVAVRIVARIH